MTFQGDSFERIVACHKAPAAFLGDRSKVREGLGFATKKPRLEPPLRFCGSHVFERGRMAVIRMK